MREMNALADGFTDLNIDRLLSLFPASSELLHPDAERWMALLRRPSPADGLVAIAWWLLRRPIRLLSSVVAATRRCWRSPRLLVRSLATLPIAAAHARELTREPRIDHLHVHFASYPALSAWLIRRLTGIPYSFTAHAYDIFKEQALLTEKIADAEFVVTISEFNRRFLERYADRSTTPVHVVRCGVDISRFPFREHPVPPDGPVSAACVAKLEEKKGHRILFQALARGGPALDRIKVDLIGDGPLRDELRERAREHGLSDRIRFCGSLDENHVRDLLAGSDLFVLPSTVAADGSMEGVPVALMEALATGLTAVSTRLSGIPGTDQGRRKRLPGRAR